MLNPLGTMIILTVVFTRAFGATQSYAAYLLSGLIAYNFFAQTSTAAMSNIVWGSALIHHIYLPRTSFAISSIGTGLVNLVLSLVPLALVMVVTGVPLTWTVIYLPISMAILAAFALGVGLLLSTLAVYFPDVAEMYQIALMAWMYLTPIIYPENIIPQNYQWLLFNLNPLYHVIKLFRLPLYYGLIPSPERLGAAAAVSLVALAIGWLVFTRKADEFAYRV
jgi:ABC-type polysaccharide/polyol phosphate export permease